MARIQKIQHLKGNNLTVNNGNVAAIPNAGVLLPGELAINFNEKDATIIMGTVANSGTTSTSVTATTSVAEFKSKKWLETYILGTANTSEVKTLKYISDTLGLLVGNDADSVVNTWEEVKTFLSSIPSGETYNLMSLLNNKASGELTVNNTTKLYDNTSITATSGSVNGITYSVLKVNVGAVTPSVSGTWNAGFTTYTPSAWSDNSNTTIRAAKLSDVRDFYDKFNKMFTLDEGQGTIRVNYDLYGVGEISAYGAGTGSTGGGGGSSYNRLDLWGDYSVDKAGYVLSAYLGNDLNSRLSAIEGNGATSIVVNGSGNAITNVSKAGTTLTFSKGSTFLEGNELITLSGDVTGTGNTAITTSIAASTITGKLLTGYSVGSNSAVAATDSILSAFGKIQGQINARPGTVTSVGLTLPTGLSASTATITSSGTFAVNFASGYSIPTTSKQTNWDTAYTNNHTHANLSVISGITSTNITNWDNAYSSVTAATNVNTVSTIVKRDASGNFSAGTITASLSGNATSASKVNNILTRGTYLTGSNFDGSAATTWAVDATTTNTASKIVARDASGNFSAGTITATLSGNASSATKLQTSRTIWGQSFDGTGNVSGSMYGVRSINNDVIDYMTTGGQYFYTMSNNQSPLLTLSSNVGIGTTDPQYKLDVNGSTRISGSLSITDTIIRSNAYAVDSDVYGNLNWKTGAENWYNWNVGGIMCVFKSGNVMIGSTTDSGHKLNVNGVLRNIYEGDPLTETIVSKSLAYNSNPFGLITRIYGSGVVSLQSQRESNNSETFGLTLQPLGGNVGIGTTSTSYKLDVSGTFRVNYNYSTTFTGNDINFTRADGSSYINAANTLSLGAGGTSGVLNITSNNVATFKELLLTDGARIYSAAGAGLGISLFNEPSFNPNYGLMFAQTVYKGKHGAVSGDWATYFTMSPDVGRGWIFTNSASSSGGNVASISNTGNLTCSGEVTAYSASDLRLKTNIRPIMSAIDVINKLNPVSYNWNEKAKELNPLKTDSTEYGLIAQELEVVMPELVHEIYGKYKSIDYVKLVPILIKAVQELKSEINEMKNK